MDCRPSGLESTLERILSFAASCLSQSKTDPIAEICSALQADLGCRLEYDPGTESMTASTIWLGGETKTADISFSLSHGGPLTQAVRERKTQAWERPNTRTRFYRELERIAGQAIGPTIIAVPHSDGPVTGALLVARLAGSCRFDAEERAAVQVMASVAELAEANRRLHSQSEALRDRSTRLEAQVLQSAKLAATGKLAASIAHEINNPLQSVQSCIYLVNNSVATEGHGRQYLDIAREELDRIARIVQRLTDFYRPSQEGPRPTNLNQLIESVLVLMGKRIQHGNVKITKNLAEELPAVQASADQMKQVFVNLILNALEAMPAGGELVLSTAVVDQPGGRFVEVALKDSGAGVSPEVLGRIFDPFFTTKSKGTGLGLSISHDIVQRHGGSIRVESRPGEGSVFAVCLPIVGIS